MLSGFGVRLTPIRIDHAEALKAAVADGELWRLHTTLVPHPDGVLGFIEKALADQTAGKGLTFVTQVDGHAAIAGSTRFREANIPHKRVEIGNTFLGRTWQRTHLNTAAKYLMLKHAFETLGFNRVEFLTDYFNERSQSALRRIGAKYEGMLRSHMVMPGGRIRDSVLYSIVAPEWPAVKLHLESKLV